MIIFVLSYCAFLEFEFEFYCHGRFFFIETLCPLDKVKQNKLSILSSQLTEERISFHHIGHTDDFLFFNAFAWLFSQEADFCIVN